MIFPRRLLRKGKVPGWLIVAFPVLITLYRIVDAAANVDFLASRYDNIDAIVVNPFLLFVVFLVGLVWLRYVGSEVSNTEPPVFIGIERVQFARLGSRRFAEVAWAVSLRNGEVSIGAPRCPEHNAELEYKPTFHFRPQKFAFPPLQPAIEFNADPALMTITNALSTLPALEHPPPPPEQVALLEEAEERRKKKEADDEEREELGLRELKQGDSSGKEDGPYCFECRELKPLPKTVGQCQYDVRLQVEAELRNDVEEICD